MAKSVSLSKKEETAVTESRRDTRTTSGPAKSNKPAFVFGKMNYILMIAGIVVMSLGYILMIGGAPKEPNVFNSPELYSPMRITYAPIIILVGLAIEVVAIMYKAKD